MTTLAIEKGPDYYRKVYGLPVAIIATLLIWFMDTPTSLSLEGHRALALFAGIFVLYLTEAIPLPITSLAVVPFAVLMGIVNPKIALEGFSSTSVYLIVGAFILAAAMVKSKLADRVTYLIMSKIGTSTTRITLGIMLANIVLAFLVPSSTARTAIMLPICMSILKDFGKEGRSNFAVNLLLTLAFTNATISAGILTATVPNPVTIDFIVKAGGSAISYADWFMYGFPPALLMTLITWVVIQKMYKSEQSHIPGGQTFVKEKLVELGKLTGNEIRSILIFSLVVVLWIFGKQLHVNTTIACLFGAILLCLPQIGFLTWDDVNKGIAWKIIFIAGGGISLGIIMMKTGAAKWIAQSIFDSLGFATLPLVIVLVLLMLILQYMHLLFVGTTAMATAFLPIIIGIAQVMNISPAILALPAGMIIGGYPLLMFYNTLPNILVYGTDKLMVSDFPKVGFVVCTIAVIVYSLCATTYWKWLGLFS
ncbi:MAG: DASS family sodium-coupled anion symporter [Sulfurospirillaceae bacterium]|nr:DASS family sodium-coupled anion symporter [Sulfurospirillaceae bacterium]MDD2827177.1 DASS family sodium-coupled anion symporter [Sulfurospirillaceae bacterium]